ncbi:chymotrypsin B [Trichonephila inaurata madagascariensis]|uniref:Chymotrypsin B n=1 Tax=Trichonephila inaurata madagascariensis TaxID=2747483 RepID=A0A8X7C7Z1_9ARAC|nr:chymotrypsin B [Trichonephila inaurata madagascariensis]
MLTSRLNFTVKNVFRNLVEVEAIILDMNHCLVNQRRQDFHRSQICADTYAGDSCADDNAGPLFVKQRDQWFIVGFRDWSVDCRSPSTVVYTRVSEYLPWIESQTRNYPDCITGPLYQLPRKPNIDNCGIPNEMESERLAGGNNTTPFEFPWMKPQEITFYNSSKSGIDTANQMGIVGINSQMISVGKKLGATTKKNFPQNLSHQLVIGQLEGRSLNTSGMPTQLQFRVKRFLPPKECKNL